MNSSVRLPRPVGVAASASRSAGVSTSRQTETSATARPARRLRSIVVATTSGVDQGIPLKGSVCASPHPDEPVSAVLARAEHHICAPCELLERVLHAPPGDARDVRRDEQGRVALSERDPHPGPQRVAEPGAVLLHESLARPDEPGERLPLVGEGVEDAGVGDLLPAAIEGVEEQGSRELRGAVFAQHAG